MLSLSCFTFGMHAIPMATGMLKKSAARYRCVNEPYLKISWFHNILIFTVYLNAPIASFLDVVCLNACIHTLLAVQMSSVETVFHCN